MEFLILIISGSIIGFLSSFFGIGGGALIVPMLYSIFSNIPDTIVISTSLGTIFFITSINSFHFFRAGLVPKRKTLINLMLGTFIGGYIGSQLTYLVNTSMSKKIIATILILIVFKNLFFKVKATQQKWKENFSTIFITGFAGALISSLTGLGGGVIFIPMFMIFVKLPARLTSPYSNIAMVFATLIGTLPHLFTTNTHPQIMGELLSHFFIGQVNVAIILLLGVSAFFTSKLGVKVNARVSEEKKKLILTLLLLTLSLKMFLA